MGLRAVPRVFLVLLRAYDQLSVSPPVYTGDAWF